MKPFWVDKLDETMDKFGTNLDGFGKEIQAHLTLIKTWQEEADRRIRRRPRAKRRKEAPARRGRCQKISEALKRINALKREGRLHQV